MKTKPGKKTKTTVQARRRVADRAFDQQAAAHAAKFENDMSAFGVRVFDALGNGKRSVLEAAIALHEPTSVVQASADHLEATGMLVRR
jgi:hypothetical protein